jgi:hypothetical protein
MNREDIIRMAREAGAVFPADGSYHRFESEESLEAFAALVASAEREACAKVCEEHAKVYAKLEKSPITSAAWAACIDIHDSISERGEA